MPATPAWPPKSLPRLFVRQPLGDGATVQLDAKQANYLGNVLRLGTGAELLVFDDISGEWLARIAETGKKRMTLSIERKTREQESIPDVWLAFAPVKRAQTDWLVEKATELGAARLVPVITQRTIAETVRLDRLESIAIEGRVDIDDSDDLVMTVLQRQIDSRALAATEFQGQCGIDQAFAQQAGHDLGHIVDGSIVDTHDLEAARIVNRLFA